jgi:hypothetical protein
LTAATGVVSMQRTSHAASHEEESPMTAACQSFALLVSAASAAIAG